MSKKPKKEEDQEAEIEPYDYTDELHSMEVVLDIINKDLVDEALT